MLLDRLSTAFGPSGCESEVREIILDAVKDRVSEHQTDALGNLIVLKRGNGRSRGGPPLKVMVTAAPIMICGLIRRKQALL